MYVLLDDDLTLHEEQIELQEELFLRVNEKFDSHTRVPISVIDGDGNVCFNLGWERERYVPVRNTSGSEIPYFCNFTGEDLCAEEELLDFTFIESLDTLWFDSINEYSWQVIRLINRRYPEKTLITQDERARYFPDIRVRVDDKPESGPRCACFIKGNVVPEKEGVYTVYSLIISLTWAKLRHGKGGNPDKKPAESSFDGGDPDARTVLVIDPAIGADGPGDIMHKVSAYVALARVHGWEPVVRLNHESWLADFEGEDIWSRHFLPASSVTVADIETAAQCISVYENRPFELFGRVNPYIWMFSSLYHDCSFDIRLNESARQKVFAKVPDELKSGQRVLGVLLRASDRDALFGSKTDVPRILNRVERLFRDGQYARIFVATEETEMLEAAKARFGTDIVLSVDQQRVENDDEDKDKLLAYRLGRRYDEKADLMTDYLAVIGALCFCETVYADKRYCGPTFLITALANDISGRQPKMLPVVYMSGEYVIRCDVEKLLDTVKRDERIIIYGAGMNGAKLRDLLSPVTSDILFCDRRACEGEFSLDGCRVVSPDAMVEDYNGELIVISPYGAFEHVREELVSKGVPGDRIFE